MAIFKMRAIRSRRVSMNRSSRTTITNNTYGGRYVPEECQEEHGHSPKDYDSKDSPGLQFVSPTL